LVFVCRRSYTQSS